MISDLIYIWITYQKKFRKFLTKNSEMLLYPLHSTIAAQKVKFSIKYFFSKCDLIGRKLRSWSHLLKKSLMENFIFCAVYVPSNLVTCRQPSWEGITPPSPVYLKHTLWVAVQKSLMFLDKFTYWWLSLESVIKLCNIGSKRI